MMLAMAEASLGSRVSPTTTTMTLVMASATYGVRRFLLMAATLAGSIRSRPSA